MTAIARLTRLLVLVLATGALLAPALRAAERRQARSDGQDAQVPDLRRSRMKALPTTASDLPRICVPRPRKAMRLRRPIGPSPRRSSSTSALFAAASMPPQTSPLRRDFLSAVAASGASPFLLQPHA
jgi:hypothetical protein